MMEAVRTWLWGVIAASLLSALALSVLPEGSTKVVCRFAASLCILACVLRPLGMVQVDAAALELGIYETKRQELDEIYKRQAEQSMETIIEQTCRTYISDKAAELGLRCAVEVVAQTKSGVPQVRQVVLRGEKSEKLSEYIEHSLGIARERQIWLDAE